VTSGLSPEWEYSILFLVLIVVIIGRRAVRLVQGTPYSTGRIFGFTGVYVLLFVALAASTLAAAVGAWGIDALFLVAPYGAVVAAAALVAIPYVRRIVKFEHRGPGDLYYRLPPFVPALYLVLFALRFAIELVLFGPSVVTSFSPPTSIPSGFILTLVAVDLLFGASTGLLLGRSIGVYEAHRALPKVAAPLDSAPLPGGNPP